MSKRILLVVHKDLVPPSNITEELDRFNTPWITEYDVVQSLKKLKYNVRVIGIQESIQPLLNELNKFIVSAHEINFFPMNSKPLLRFSMNLIDLLYLLTKSSFSNEFKAIIKVFNDFNDFL